MTIKPPFTQEFHMAAFPEGLRLVVDGKCVWDSKGDSTIEGAGWAEAAFDIPRLITHDEYVLQQHIRNAEYEAKIKEIMSWTPKTPIKDMLNCESDEERW